MTSEPPALDRVFGALSDPVRRGILERLTRGPCSVTELGAPFPISPPAISRHLNVLEDSGLIERWKQGRTHYCRLLGDPLRVAGDWIEHQRAFWDRQFDALDTFLQKEDDTWTPPENERPASPSGSTDRSGHRPNGSTKPGRGRKR